MAKVSVMELVHNGFLYPRETKAVSSLYALLLLSHSMNHQCLSTVTLGCTCCHWNKDDVCFCMRYLCHWHHIAMYLLHSFFVSHHIGHTCLAPDTG